MRQLRFFGDFLNLDLVYGGFGGLDHLNVLHLLGVPVVALQRGLLLLVVAIGLELLQRIGDGRVLAADNLDLPLRGVVAVGIHLLGLRLGLRRHLLIGLGSTLLAHLCGVGASRLARDHDLVSAQHGLHVILALGVSLRPRILGISLSVQLLRSHIYETTEVRGTSRTV